MSEQFFKIYQWMIEEGLSGSDLSVYAFIYTMNEMNIQVRGQKYISDHTGFCIDTVSRSLKRLEANGFIFREKSPSVASPVSYVTEKCRNRKMSERVRQNVETDSTESRNGFDKMSEHLISNKRNNKRSNERTNKKTLGANSRSLEVIAAETLVSLSLPSDPELVESILGFIDHRKKMKKPLTDRALVLNIKKAHGLSDGKTSEMTKLFNLAVERGWQGIYPEKDGKGGVKQNDNGKHERFFK